ncbi:hypothetical protein [Streptomyces mirabilis]|uniref:ABC transporter ATP-binding protein C-terminal domain-containing protein n=1 Tax=Streptomyces mirabilis TaxID=68239 RepID=UPI003318A6D9
MVVIEPDTPVIMSLADRVTVMADSRALCSGTPQEVCADPRVADAYLGGDLVAHRRSRAMTANVTGMPTPGPAALPLSARLQGRDAGGGRRECRARGPLPSFRLGGRGAG